MKKVLIFLLLISQLLSARSQTTVKLTSPDKTITVRINTTEGQFSYTIQHKNVPFLEASPLGVTTATADFTRQLALLGITRKTIKENYFLNRSKCSNVRYQANELTCSFLNRDKDTLKVMFRVSNTDVAFRYLLPPDKHSAMEATITAEATGFRLPAGATTFITPQATAMTGYEKSKPSYEEHYTVEEPVGTGSKYGLGYTFPALFHLPGKGWILLSETGTAGNYPGTRLSDATPDNLYRIAFPQAGENNGLGDTNAVVRLPFATPWRTITLGTTLRPVVESTVATDVVAPVVHSGKVFNPGRASWSWLIWQDASCNYNDQQTFIDLAASLQCEYILIDAYWDTKIGKEKMAELAAYAKQKNVAILLWYNSNGQWNNTPQTPKNRMDTHAARVEEMAWMQSIGVKGIKVDFFGGDKQTTLQLYHDILTDAATYGLGVDFHGATLPRGWERMYPNYLTSEAALVSENLVFQQSFYDNYPRIATIYPFTRNAVAAMDFGGVILNNRLSRNNDKGTTRRTTDAFEVATAIIFFSPLQNWGLTPNNLKDKPSFLFDFIRQVPTVWDETRLIDGYPGKYCVLARRKGKQWYLGAINGENTTRDLTLSLPMLPARPMTLIRDGEGQAAQVETLKIEESKTVKLTLAPNGGAVLYTATSKKDIN